MKKIKFFTVLTLLLLFWGAVQVHAAEGTILNVYHQGTQASKGSGSITWQYVAMDTGKQLGGEPVSAAAVILSGNGSTLDYAPEYCAAHQWKPVAPWTETAEQGAIASRVIVKGSVSDLGTYAFSDMRNLSTVILEEGVLSIGDYAFSNNPNLTAIYLPDSVASISNSAFDAINRDAVIRCSQDSYAYAYAKEQGLKVQPAVCTHGQTSWKETRKATCTATGQKIQTCPDCGAILKTETIPALGHSWSGWTVIEKASVHSPEKQERTCSRCSAKEHRTVGSVLTPPSSPVKAASLKLSGKSSLLTGKSLRLKLSVAPSNAEKPSVTWKSSNSRYASVSSSGVVKAKTAGAGKTVTITAAARDGSGAKAAIRIKIKGAVKKIKLQAPKTLKTGKKARIKATVTVGKGGSKALTWKSSNRNYAVVTSKGVVKALKRGKGKTVTITAAARDGSGRKARVRIRLK